MNTDVQQWAERLFQLRRALNLDQQEMGVLLGVSREWVSKLENQKGEFSKAITSAIELHERELSQSLRVGESPADYMKLREVKERKISLPLVRVSPMVDPRHAPKAAPSGRVDCETYFMKLLDAAEAEGDPDVWPSIMRRLKKTFPLDEFTPPETEK